MFCHYCGAANPENSQFCRACGRSIAWEPKSTNATEVKSELSKVKLEQPKEEPAPSSLSDGQDRPESAPQQNQQAAGPKMPVDDECEKHLEHLRALPENGKAKIRDEIHERASITPSKPKYIPTTKPKDVSVKCPRCKLRAYP